MKTSPDTLEEDFSRAVTRTSRGHSFAGSLLALKLVNGVANVGRGESALVSNMLEDVYLVKNGGQLTCLEMNSGKVAKRIRTKGSGTHYASPLVAGGHLYSFAGNGRVTVLTLGGRPEIVAVNEVGEKVYATPAILDGVIYLRTPTKLFAFKDLQQ